MAHAEKRSIPAALGTVPSGRATTGSSEGTPSAGFLLACTAGLSFLWPCLGSFATMHFRHAMAGSASFIMTDWHAVIMGAFYLLAALACLAARGPLCRLLLSPRAIGFVAGGGAMGAVGHFLMVASPWAGGAPLATTMVLAGLLLAVAFAVAHILAWGMLLARVPIGWTILALVASNALSYAVQLAVNASAAAALSVYLVVCPVASLTFWIAAWHSAGMAAEGEVPRAAWLAAEPLSDADLPLGRALRGVSWRYVVPAVALIYFEQALTSLLFQRYTDWPSENLTVTLAVSCAIWVVATVCVWVAAAGSRSGRPRSGASAFAEGLARSPASGFVAEPGSATEPATAPAPPHAAEFSGRRLDMLLNTLFAALLVVYMAALFVTVLLPDGDRLFTERLLVAAGCSFRVMLWVAVACAVWRRSTSPVLGYLTYVVLVLAVPVSRLASIAFGRLPADVIARLTSPAVIVGAAAAMLFVLAVAFVAANAWGMRRALQREEDMQGRAPAGDVLSTRAATLAEIASEAELTAREAEVLELVCSGYSARHAGERLGISESTVVSHVTHIYRKLGVSSRQELVAFVEGRSAAR